jgi:hypothetical protein
MVTVLVVVVVHEGNNCQPRRRSAARKIRPSKTKLSSRTVIIEFLFSVDKDMIDDSSNDVHTAASQEDITVEATEVIYCAICTFPPEVPNPPFLD